MTKSNAVLNASPREAVGKGAARALRREGKVPAIVYNKDSAPMNIALSARDLKVEYQRGRFRSRIVDLKVDNKTIQALPKDMQFHPVTDDIEHVDFILVDPKVALRVQVPVKFTGHEKAVGLKRGGVLNIVRHEVEFMCKPDSIPSQISFNIQKLDIGDSVHIEDFDLPEGVEPTIQRNFTVATIAGRAKEEEKPTTAAAEGDAAAAEGDDAKKEEAKK
ncbi:MAG: 50S ribosomal protein L25/general stress protein Ctc [Rickettsiales bacterium]